MARKKSLDPPLVEVHWLDAMVDTGQFHSPEEVAEEVVLMKRRTTGYFVLEDPGDEPTAKLYIAQDFDPPSGFGTVSVIPKGWITRRRVVSGKKPSGFGRRAVRRAKKGGRNG